MFSSGMAGSSVRDINVRFRMYAFFTVALFALGTVLYWRGALFVSTDYVELPQHDKKVKQATTGKLKVPSYLLEN